MTDPSDPLDQARQNLADGDPAAALGICQTLLEAGDAAAWDLMGLALRSLGRLGEALDAGKNAVRLSPDFAQAFSNLGNTRAALGDDESAIADYRRAIELFPDYAEAWANRGMAEKRLGDKENATRSFRQTARLLGANPPLLNDIGNQLFDLGAFEDAATCYQNAIRAAPNFANAANNLGNTFVQLLRPADAISAYEQAIAAEPAHPDARNGLALALLLSGDYARGWPAYEARFDKPGAPRRAVHPSPSWQGEALDGKSILLFAEQGLGDTLQFLRFVRQVKDRGAHVTLQCPAALGELAATAEGVDRTCHSEDSAPQTDFNAPLMSLPLILDLSEARDLRMSAPYIQVPEFTQAARSRPRVGLVWAGNPDHVNDRNRSLALADLQPLLEMDAFEFVSLQVGAARSEIADLPLALQPPDLGGGFQNFADTARAISALDLVISVDTALAHLAGAMGRPGCVLLAHVPDWRWGVDGDETIWYPSLKLFRQDRPGDWSDAIARIIAVLDVKIGEFHSKE